MRTASSGSSLQQPARSQVRLEAAPVEATRRQRKATQSDLFAASAGLIAKNAQEQFTGFGRCSRWPRFRSRCGSTTLGESSREARRLIRCICPDESGVYGMLDVAGTLIYIGKAKSIRRRLLSYLLTKPTDPKAARIIDHTERLLWETTPHELTALLRELELIRRFRPRFNVQGQPGRFRRVFICLGRDPAPRAFTAAAPNSGSKQVFGPVRSKRILREAVRQINIWFRLRDCPERIPMVFADQLALFDQSSAPLCPRHELGTCPAPCASGCSRRAYFENVNAAQAFLDGRNLQLLDHLRDEMASAAANCQFERAANLRDAWQPLAWLQRELAGIREARRNYSFIYPLTDGADRKRWCLIRGGELIACVSAPRNPRSAAKCLERIERLFPTRSKNHHAIATTGAEGPSAETDTQNCGDQPTPDREDLEVVTIVSGWFRRYPDELKRTLTPLAARTLCQQFLLREKARNNAG